MGGVIDGFIVRRKSAVLMCAFAMVSIGLTTLAMPRVARAQPSEECGINGPCVEMGVAWNHAGTWKIESDADHFIYCPAGDTVTVEVLADFTTGFFLCGDCSHGERDWDWSVSGASSYTIDSIGTHDEVTSLDSNQQLATITLGEAGDTITVTCDVSAIPQGSCGEDSHFGNHGGASASCTIKLWRVDLTSDADPSPYSGAPFYAPTFADEVESTVDAVGATAVDYEWASEFMDTAGTIATQYGNSSWTGEIIDRTRVSCEVTVLNECAYYEYESASETIYMSLIERRPDWEIDVTYTGMDEKWVETVELAFPVRDWSIDEKPAYGQNTNEVQTYRNENQILVTPVYANEEDFPDDYAEFENSVPEEIVSGPNTGFFYCKSPSLFEVRRRGRCNYWITPAAGEPNIPDTDPNGQPFSNWLEVLTNEFQDTCKCLDPDLHDGVGGNIFYRANKWHEEYGCPDSPNERLLGHQSRIEDGIDTGNPALWDAVYRCDLLYAESVEELRAGVEAARSGANQKIHEHTAELHSYVGGDWTKHNYKGDVPVYRDSLEAWMNEYMIF